MSAPCMVCASTRTAPSTQFPSPEMLYCADCQAHFFVGEVATERLYTTDYFSGEEYFSYARDTWAHSLNFARKIDLLLQRTDPPKLVVEVGCAYGFFLAAVKQRFPQARCVGLDVNDGVLDEARKLNPGCEFYNCLSPSGQPGPLQADWLILWDTFEHLPNAQIVQDYVSAFLAKTGVCSLTTVDSGSTVARFRGTRWRQFHPPQHVLYPCSQTFSQLAERWSLSLVYDQPFGYYRATRQYLVVFERWLPKKWRKPFRSLLNWRFFSLPIYLNLFDTRMYVLRFKPSPGG